MTNLKINIIIAGRTYPLNVNSTEEEEGMRKAAKNINKLIANFEENYAVADKQDVLAMCALQFASRLEIESISKENKDNEALQKIKALIGLIDANI